MVTVLSNIRFWSGIFWMRYEVLNSLRLGIEIDTGVNREPMTMCKEFNGTSVR